MDFGIILINLLTTALIYTLPILIYRYAIIKKPLPKRKAKWIAIGYGILSWIFVSVLLISTTGNRNASNAAVIWGFVNYSILKSGYVENNLSDNR